MNVVAGDGMDIDPKAWTPQHRLLLEAVAREPLVRAFLSTRRSSARCADKAGPERFWKVKIRRGGGTIIISTLGLTGQSATLNVVGKYRRRQAMAAARSSIGGSPKRRFTRLRHRPEDRCGSATWRRPVSGSSLHQADKHCSLEARRMKQLVPRMQILKVRVLLKIHRPREAPSCL
jgi:hypothetical protein